MKTLLRFAAITAASTALVAGSMNVAQAAPGDGVSANVSVQPAYTSGFASSTTSLVPVAIAPTTPGVTISALYATVNVNNVPVANDVFVSPSTGFTYQRAWGAGLVTLTNVVAQGQDTRAPGNSFFKKPIAANVAPAQVRYGLEYRSGLQIKKRGKKLTFTVKARYVNNVGKNVRVNKATIQVLKGKKWKTLKKIKLKSNGTRTYKKSDSKKRNYRLVIQETPVYQGGQTKKFRKL